jgi:hypothetical protein
LLSCESPRSSRPAAARLGSPVISARDDGALLRALAEHDVPNVVIGGWAVITHGYVRFTRDVDVLIPDRPDVHERAAAAMAAIGARRLSGEEITTASRIPEQGWQLDSEHGRIDILLEGEPPLDFASVHAGGLDTEIDGVPIRVAGLAHLSAFKRLSDRPHDRVDLAELEAIVGTLPHLPMPGLDN